MPTSTSTSRKAAAARSAPAKKTADEEQHHPNGKHGLSVHTLDVKPELHIPYLTPRDVASNVVSMTRTARSRVPTRDLVFYGGLGALAAAGALEWPIAVAVAGATAVVRGRGRSRESSESSESSE